MKEIFAGFLSVSIASSLVICLVLLLRLILKKAPKALICILWSLVIVRLLLPFEIPVSFSLRPDTPLFSGMDTQLFIDTDPLREEEVPDFIPQKVVKSDRINNRITVQIDYVAIAGLVWALVVFGLLLYALISYLRLRNRLRDAVCLEKNVFVSSALGTAFMLGYIRPKIYLPNSLEPQAAELVIAHEWAHKKRGDHWLKLIAFICLSLHWFNPFVWVMYLLLCRDIEDACDERVIRDIDTETRKAYSTALLSCGKPHHLPTVCPVAFGEVSIKNRIVNVLNYRKPALWICIIAVVAIVLTATFFMTDPAVKQPPYYDQLTQLLGQPMDEVYTALGISAEDVETDDNLTRGKTPIQVEIAGVPMNLYLIYGRQDHLAGFQYAAIYVGDDTQQAAEDAVKLARNRWMSYGYGYSADLMEDPDRLYRISVEEVKELFTNPRREHVGISELEDFWDITDQSNQAVKDYLAALENAMTLEPSVEYSFQTRFFHYFSAWCDTNETEDDITTLVLCYRAQNLPVQNENNYQNIAFDNKTWWDKLVDWLI